MKKMTRVIISILLFLAATAAAPGEGKEFKERIDRLEQKCAIAMKKTGGTAEQRILTAMICSAEALEICAEVEKNREAASFLEKRSAEFREGVTKSETMKEKLFSAAVGIYNFSLAITSIHAGISPMRMAVKNIESHAVRIQQTDSLSIDMKTALLLSECMKLALLSAAAVDPEGRHRDDLKRMSLDFDGEARNVTGAADGLALSATHLARMFNHYSVLRYPGMKKPFEELLPPAKRSFHTIEEKTIAAFSSLASTALLHARRRDQ